MQNDITGVLLCGGMGSRMFPFTNYTNKHFLPISWQPMFFYPLSLLMQLGIRNIIIICNKSEEANFRKNYSFLQSIGLRVDITIQHQPNGVSDAILTALPKIRTSNIFAMLGDNVFYGEHFVHKMLTDETLQRSCKIYTARSSTPQRFGVVKRDRNGYVTDLIEKPADHISKEIITGMYYFAKDFLFEASQNLQKPANGEFDIIQILKFAMINKHLDILKLPKDTFWIDAGTNDDYLKANRFMNGVVSSNINKAIYLETIALENKWIDFLSVQEILKNYPECEYKNGLTAKLSNCTNVR